MTGPSIRIVGYEFQAYFHQGLVVALMIVNPDSAVVRVLDAKSSLAMLASSANPSSRLPLQARNRSSCSCQFMR